METRHEQLGVTPPLPPRCTRFNHSHRLTCNVITFKPTTASCFLWDKLTITDNDQTFRVVLYPVQRNGFVPFQLRGFRTPRNSDVVPQPVTGASRATGPVSRTFGGKPGVTGIMAAAWAALRGGEVPALCWAAASDTYHDLQSSPPPVTNHMLRRIIHRSAEIPQQAVSRVSHVNSATTASGV